MLERSGTNQISMPTQYVHITKATAGIYRDCDKICISGPLPPGPGTMMALHYISTMRLSNIDWVYNQ